VKGRLERKEGVEIFSLSPRGFIYLGKVLGDSSTQGKVQSDSSTQVRFKKWFIHSGKVQEDSSTQSRVKGGSSTQVRFKGIHPLI
jgi:hypothetical protein